MSTSDRGSKPPLSQGAWQTYRRLLTYLRPHRGPFATGHARRDGVFRQHGGLHCVRQILRRRHVREQRSAHDHLAAGRAHRTLRRSRSGRLHPDVLHGLRGAAHRQAPARRVVRSAAAAAYRLLRSPFHQRAALASDLQHGADRTGGHRFGHRDAARNAYDCGLYHRALLVQRAPRVDLAHDGAARRLAGDDHQSQVPPVQPADSGFDGRHHPRCEGDARCAARDQGLQRGRSIRARSSSR